MCAPKPRCDAAALSVSHACCAPCNRSAAESEAALAAQQLEFAGKREEGLREDLAAARARLAEARGASDAASGAERLLKTRLAAAEEEVTRLRDTAAQASQDRAAKETQLKEVRAAREALAEDVDSLKRGEHQMKLAMERQAADYQRLVEVRDALEESLASKGEQLLAAKREASEATGAAKAEAAAARGELGRELQEARAKLAESEATLKWAKGEMSSMAARLEGRVAELESELSDKGFEGERLKAQVRSNPAGRRILMSAEGYYINIHVHQA